MKENSIEVTIKQLETMLKCRIQQKEIIECSGGTCINCNPDIKALTHSIYILKEYEKLLEIASEFINRKPEQFSIGEFRNKLTELEKTIDLNNEEEIALNNRIIDLETKIEKKDKIIDKMAEYIADITDCPLENCDIDLDCEKRCNANIEKECWKLYFENKVESEENK